MDIEAFRTKIQNSIHQLKDEIALLKASTKPISPENSIGRISRMDAINSKGVAEAALRGKKKKLTKLYLALKNLDGEGFGRCNRCGQSIREARLLYMPESSYCIRCADYE